MFAGPIETWPLEKQKEYARLREAATKDFAFVVNPGQGYSDKPIANIENKPAPDIDIRG